MVTSHDVLSVLRPYCSDSSNPPVLRKRLFVLIEKVRVVITVTDVVD